jgi:hypothetical protein
MTKRKLFGDINHKFNGLKKVKKYTQFFDQSMIQCRHINLITKLENSQGHTLLAHSYIEKDLTSYYEDLLSESCLDQSEVIRKITRHIPSLITEDQNVALLRPVSLRK